MTSTNTGFASLLPDLDTTDEQRQDLVQRGAERRAGAVQRLSGITPPSVVSRQNRLQRQQEREQAQAEAQPGAFEAIGHAFASESMLPWAQRWLGRRNYDFDPDFNPYDDENFERLTKDLDQSFHSAFDDAVSLPHAMRIRDQMMEVQAHRQKLSSLGWAGAGLRMAAAVLDPAALGVSALSLGAAGPWAYGANLTRMQRLVRGGLVAAGTESTIEGYVTTQDPQRSIRDVFYAGAGGFLLGGAGSVLAGSRLERASHRLRREIELSEATEAAVRDGMVPAGAGPQQVKQAVASNVLSDKGRAYFRDQLAPDAERQFVDDLITASGLDPDLDADLIAEIRQMDPAEAATHFGPPTPASDAGAAAARPVSAGVDPEAANTIGDRIARQEVDETDDIRLAPEEGGAADSAGRGVSGAGEDEWGLTPKSGKRPGDLDLSGTSRARAAFTRARRSFASILGMSDSERTRTAASAYADDRLLKVDGSGGTPSASAWVTRTVHGFQARFYRLGLREFSEWRKRHNVPTAMLDKHRDQFFREVGQTIRRPRGAYTDDPHVNRVADLQRDLQREMLELGQRHRVKGFERVSANDQYLMRMHRHGMLDSMVARHGEDAIVRLYAGAIQAASEDLGDDAAMTIAHGFTRSVRKLGDRTELDKARAFQTDDPEALSELLKENVPDITDAQVEDIIYSVTPRQADANLTPRARRRLGLDETYTDSMPDGTRLSIADLIEDNAETIFNLYTRQVVGASASSEVYRVMRSSADDVIERFDHLRDRLNRDMQAAGVDDRIRARDLELLETLDKHVRGIPLTKNTSTARTMRVLRGISHMLMSGQFGVAQIGEFGNVAAEMTWRAMLQQMPAVGRVARRARDGSLPDPLLEEIEQLTALGTERVSQQAFSRFEMEGGIVEFGGAQLERTLRRGQRLSNDLSLMAPINSALQRLAGASAAQRITNAAFTGKPMSARRLSALGLNQDDASRIYGQIRQHATMEDGLLGRRLRRINIDNWSDQESASRLVHALDRWSRRAIQTSDVGSMHPFMTTDFGRLLFQFRTFVVQAWEAQFLHRAQMRDWQAFTSASYVAFTAGLAYIGQQYAMSLGRPDAEEFRQERLNPGAISRATVQRAAWSTLWPGIIDTTGYLAGADPIFTARHTGMDTDFFFGSPAVSVTQNLGRGVRGVAGGVTQGDEEMTSSGWSAFSRLLPLRRVFGISNIVEPLSHRFDE